MKTKFAIIASKADPAGVNIAKFLVENHGFEKTKETFRENPVHCNARLDAQLVFISDAQIYADYLGSIDAEFLVFASKHKSESAKPTLTVHAIGNWGKAERGGKDNTLVPTSAALIKNYLVALQKAKESRNLAYEVSLECTHHGPLLGKPTVFIELGSSEAQWSDAKAAEAIADVVANNTSAGPVASAKTAPKTRYKTAIALGGGHYCPDFTKLLLRTDYSVSHICPKYALQNLSAELLNQAVSKTVEPVKEIVLDYKGLGEHKEKVLALAGASGLAVRRVRNLLDGKTS